ncbi:MAG: hypothetical protein QXG00_08350 [Candidatus Woesearchaeota archaeon]
MKIYMVGGAVRDQILGLEPKDRDWVIVGANDQDIKYLETQGYLLVGKDFPVYLHPQTKEEYALARKECKIGSGYNGFSWFTQGVSLEEDLSRRDLTINAMAYDPINKIVIDPFGGQQDLKDKILRHVSPAFSEDPLRVLRVARFAARYGFNIDPNTMSLMSYIVKSGELDHLTAERVWKEFEKLFAEEHVVWGLEILNQCGALQRLFNIEFLNTDKHILNKAIAVNAPIASLCAIFFSGCNLNSLEKKIRFPSSVMKTVKLYRDYSDLIISFDKLSSLEKIMVLKNIGGLKQSMEFKYLLIACSIVSFFRDWMIDIEQSISLLRNIDYETLLKGVSNSEKAKVVLNEQITLLERHKYVY